MTKKCVEHWFQSYLIVTLDLCILEIRSTTTFSWVCVYYTTHYKNTSLVVGDQFKHFKTMIGPRHVGSALPLRNHGYWDHLIVNSCVGDIVVIVDAGVFVLHEIWPVSLAVVTNNLQWKKFSYLPSWEVQVAHPCKAFDSLALEG